MRQEAGQEQAVNRKNFLTSFSASTLSLSAPKNGMAGSRKKKSKQEGGRRRQWKSGSQANRGVGSGQGQVTGHPICMPDLLPTVCSPTPALCLAPAFTSHLPAHLPAHYHCHTCIDRTGAENSEKAFDIPMTPPLAPHTICTPSLTACIAAAAFPCLHAIHFHAYLIPYFYIYSYTVWKAFHLEEGQAGRHESGRPGRDVPDCCVQVPGSSDTYRIVWWAFPFYLIIRHLLLI